MIAQADPKQTLVLIHAYPLNSRMWQQVVPFLSPDLRLICPDLPGFGQRLPLDAPPTLAAMADALMRDLDERGVERASFCGVSMGGYLLFDLWQRYAQRIQALIFCDTRAEADSSEGRRGRDESIARIRGGARREVIGGLLPQLVASGSKQGPLLQRLQELADEASDEGLQAALQAMRDRPDSRPVLRTINAPTLVLVGSEDTLTPPEAARTIHQGISGSQLVELPGAGHLCPLEQPEVFSAALRRFLAA